MSAPARATPLGFIGLGRMGLPMARNLARAGHAVRVFDTAPEACARAAAVAGVTVLASPQEVAAGAEVVFTALPSDAIVTETYLGASGVLEGSRPGLVTCDCSTVRAETSQAIHAAALARSVSHLDTPMLGSAPQAESGEIFFMVGGDRAALARVEPLLAALGRLTLHVGASGTGNRIKLLHNALGAVNAVAVAESLALCTALGVDPATYIEVVRRGGGMGYSTYFDRRAERIVAGDFTPTFTLDLMLKDVTLASEMAGSALAHMPILRETLAAYAEARRAGWGGQDFSAVTHVLEARFGRPIARA
jgi:3-hydroxyisobutyrate dehydrogenase-like beta-hydroxyacid dehydrogenase